jgi:predicted RNA-binding Zn ribbon-like protein
MYDFEAGNLSLDFANTKDWHASAAPLEELNSYSDLIDWGQQAGLVPPELAVKLKLTATEHPENATITYDFAIEVREAIYRIFSRNYAGKPILEADLSLLNSVACQAMAQLRITSDGREYRWQLPATLEGANLIVWPVARAAADLLTSNQVSRVRECEDDRGCGYLFIDQTKNHSRRWCSMESCGNRAKARRHYSRLQAN